jgi:16S rRNA processing protein RimM
MTRTSSPIASAPANAAGSPIPGEPAFLAVGKLRRAHGVRGEILMEVYTDFPERLLPGIALYFGDEASPLELLKCRPHHGGLLLTFDGYTTPEAVGMLRNQVLYVKSDDRPPLEDGEYYHHQLIGLTVISDGGEVIGLVSEILETGASDVLVVQPELGAAVLIPIRDEFVRQVDLQQRTLTVHLIPGMRSEEA